MENKEELKKDKEIKDTLDEIDVIRKNIGYSEYFLVNSKMSFNYESMSQLWRNIKHRQAKL